MVLSRSTECIGLLSGRTCLCDAESVPGKRRALLCLFVYVSVRKAQKRRHWEEVFPPREATGVQTAPRFLPAEEAYAVQHLQPTKSRAGWRRSRLCFLACIHVKMAQKHRHWEGVRPHESISYLPARLLHLSFRDSPPCRSGRLARTLVAHGRARSHHNVLRRRWLGLDFFRDRKARGRLVDLIPTFAKKCRQEIIENELHRYVQRCRLGLIQAGQEC